MARTKECPLCHLDVPLVWTHGRNYGHYVYSVHKHALGDVCRGSRKRAGK